jgi:hypothetical protein
VIVSSYKKAVDVITEYVHVEGVAMFEDVFRLAALASLRSKGWSVPDGGGVGDPQGDHFALTERGMSVVWWQRGRSHEAYFTGIKHEQDGPSMFGACEEYLGIKVDPGERLPAHLWPRLARLEQGRRSWDCSGGAVRCCKREVFRRQVRVHCGAEA